MTGVSTDSGIGKDRSLLTDRGRSTGKRYRGFSLPNVPIVVRVSRL